MENSIRRSAVFALCLFLVLTVTTPPLARAQSPQRPPEYREVAAASRIQDAAARLKEFERIKAAYPASQLMAAIDRFILTAKIELATTLNEVLALQKTFLTEAKGQARIRTPFAAADQILSHPKVKTFDKAAVLAAVLEYRDRTLKASTEPGAFQGIPDDQQGAFKNFFVTGFGILVAQAYINAGDADKAMAALEAFKKEGGTPDAAYYYSLGLALNAAGRAKEAYDAYLSAAVDNHQEALAAARDLYAKINGSPDGFEAALEARAREFPYVPEPFKAPAGWMGRTVLAELFTGSECPPCVGADLGFDGLIETYPAQYLAVLEYHLPIPRPDPMINGASKVRQEYYGINSTPTVVIDGEKDASGGGPRSSAQGKFRQYKAAVDGRLAAAPDTVLKVAAVRSGETVKVEFSAGPAAAGAEYQVVLVQGEEKYKGSNGLVFHKMVVRDIVSVIPAGAKTVTFDLAACEARADHYLTEFENTNRRFQGFKFAERHHKIDRGRLQVVFFAQDLTTKRVLNAAVADVK
jgi:tetratricopeptide (TPR) repeat protein